MSINNNQVFIECECKKNGGWLDVKDNDYNIDCSNCGRVYTIKSNGQVISKSK